MIRVIRVSFTGVFICSYQIKQKRKIRNVNENALYLTPLCESFFWAIFLRKTSFRKPAHNFGVLVYLESRKPPEGTFLDVNIVT